MNAQHLLAEKQTALGMATYNKKFNSRLYNTATNGKGVRHNNALINDAMAICGHPSYKLGNRRWSSAALDFLALFDDSPVMPDIDVTSKVEFVILDGETVGVTKCVCGATSYKWDFTLDRKLDRHPGLWGAKACAVCERQMYYTDDVRVFEV